MNTCICTLRHAKTAYNDEKRYSGSIDIPLSHEGRAQAQKVATKVRGFGFDAIVTSRLRRAYETAEIISAGLIPIVQTRLCNERTFGILEGLTWDEVQALTPPILTICVGNDLHTVNPRNGEPFEDLWARAKRFRGFLMRHYSGAQVLVVSHGVFLQMFHGVLRGLTCIESLAVYPTSLQLEQFELAGDSLVRETAVKLTEEETLTW